MGVKRKPKESADQVADLVKIIEHLVQVQQLAAERINQMEQQLADFQTILFNVRQFYNNHLVVIGDYNQVYGQLYRGHQEVLVYLTKALGGLKDGQNRP